MRSSTIIAVYLSDNCEENIMKYTTLKETNLLTIAQAGPTNCEEFKKEYNNLVKYISQFYLPGHSDFTKLITAWAEKVPKRIQWLVDKGFIKQQEEYEPKLPDCPFCGEPLVYTERDHMNLDGSRYSFSCTNVNCVCIINGALTYPTKKGAADAVWKALKSSQRFYGSWISSCNLGLP